jgi:histidine triad (HIT) family protein
MSDCIFCKIINRELPSTVYFEDDKVIAIKDIYPEAPIHVLIFPKEHIDSMNEINDDNANILINIHMAAKKVAKELGISNSGYRLMNNCGIDGGQSVLHLHYHLVGGRTLSTKIL